MKASRRMAAAVCWAAIAGGGACVAGCGGGGGGDGGPFFLRVEAEAAPLTPLGAIVTVETSGGCEMEIEYSSASAGVGPFTSPRTGVGTLHVIDVAWMRADTTYELVAKAHLTDGSVREAEAIEFRTGALTGTIPEFEVTVTEAAGVQPGVTIVAPSARQGGEPLAVVPYIGVDEQGEIVWYHEVALPSGVHVNAFARPVPGMGIMIVTPEGLRVVGVLGETVAEVTASDAGVDSFHHEGLVLGEGGGGGWLTMTGEERVVDVPGLGTITALGDLILELEADGTVRWEWHAFDHLDTTRYPGPLSRNADPTGAHAWTHGNALAVFGDGSGDILYSPRHQSQLVRIDRETGDVAWLLGEGGDFTLTDPDEASGRSWFYSQHAPEPREDGSILLYDNGNERPPLGTPRRSRALLVAIDETAMTAGVLWQYWTEFYTPLLGDADTLGNGDVLVCAGAPGMPAQPAVVVEVTETTPAAIVWELRMPVMMIYRAVRVPRL